MHTTRHTACKSRNITHARTHHNTYYHTDTDTDTDTDHTHRGRGRERKRNTSGGGVGEDGGGKSRSVFAIVDHVAPNDHLELLRGRIPRR